MPIAVVERHQGENFWAVEHGQLVELFLFSTKVTDGTRWVVTAWEPCHRAWANSKCPCLHSDPKFPDVSPGETRQLKGWLSFYEGTDLGAEIRRIEKTGWRTADPRSK